MRAPACSLASTPSSAGIQLVVRCARSPVMGRPSLGQITPREGLWLRRGQMPVTRQSELAAGAAHLVLVQVWQASQSESTLQVWPTH